MQVRPLPVHAIHVATAGVHFWQKQSMRSRFLLSAVLLTAACIALFWLKFNDDVRELQNKSERLQLEEQKINSLLHYAIANQFYLVTADSPDGVLLRQKALLPILDRMIEDQVFDSYFALVKLMPDQATQRSLYAAMKSEISHDDSLLQQYLQQIGLKPEQLAKIVSQYHAELPPLLSLDKWAENPLSQELGFLWLDKIQGQYAAIIALNGVHTVSGLSPADLPEGVRLVDYVTDISGLFASYRVFVSGVVIVAYVLIGLLLWLRYRWRVALLVMLPPVLAAMLSLGVLAVMGIALNVFMMLALLLVLGIGIDYTIFLTEHPQQADTTMVAIMLSAVTSMLSFGLLALSEMPVLHGIGLVVLLGILFSYLLAPMVCRNVLGQGSTA